MNRYNPIPYIRATVFWIGWAPLTILIASSVVFMFFLPYRYRYQVAILWGYTSIGWLRLTCGLRYKITGKEHVDTLKGAAVVMCKHQSTWETVATAMLFPRQTWVLKKELMRIPFFGWAMSLLRAIAIDRASGRKAVDQLLSQGKTRLDDGTWVIIFPEGTRVPPGQTKRYKMGGALLAGHSGYPVIPVAHNAGEYWPRHSFLKHPGLIEVRIGEPIETQGKLPEQINEEVREWIEAQMQEISRARAEEPAS